MPLLKGNIQITDNIDFVREILYSVPNIKIIDMDDEEHKLPQQHPNVIGGQCLLPPVDAMIAEADSDEPLFDSIYATHLGDKFAYQFICGLVIYLYNGGNLLLYCPDGGSTVFKKFLQFMWILYGIKIGITPYENAVYDESCIPIWLGMIYKTNAFDSIEFLREYPIDAMIPGEIMDKLLVELSPLGDFNQKSQYILDLRKKLKEKPDIKVPIFEILY